MTACPSTPVMIVIRMNAKRVKNTLTAIIVTIMNILDLNQISKYVLKLEDCIAHETNNKSILIFLFRRIPEQYCPIITQFERLLSSKKYKLFQ